MAQTKTLRRKRMKVEDHRPLTIAMLREQDLPRYDELVYHSWGELKLSVHWNDESAGVGVTIGTIMWMVRLERQKMARGYRWRFKDFKGVLCDKLYFDGTLWVSQKTAGLQHRSKSMSRSQRLIRGAKKLRKPLIQQNER